MSSIVEQANHFWLYAISLPVPQIQEMLLVDIPELDYYFCYEQNIVLPFVICNVVLPYQGTGNILEIFYLFASGNLKMRFHQTSHTV